MRTCLHLSFMLLAIFCLIFSSVSAGQSAPVTLLAPARPQAEPGDSNGSPENTPTETDVLISLMDTYAYSNIDMDMPQMFAIFEPLESEGKIGLQRRDLLGDMEEIRYLDKKSWGANVELAKPGANIFVLESRPWWDENSHKYRQSQVKSIIFNGGMDTGWNEHVGLSLEIIPLIRPIGLYSPCLFTGLVLQHGKELANVPVRIGHINENGSAAATPWHETMLAMTNSAGEFSAILNEPGWWYCEAVVPGEPLKGTDGELKELESSAIFWLYIDPAPTGKKKPG